MVSLFTPFLLTRHPRICQTYLTLLKITSLLDACLLCFLSSKYDTKRTNNNIQRFPWWQQSLMECAVVDETCLEGSVESNGSRETRFREEDLKSLPVSVESRSSWCPAKRTSRLGSREHVPLLVFTAQGLCLNWTCLLITCNIVLKKDDEMGNEWGQDAFGEEVTQVNLLGDEDTTTTSSTSQIIIIIMVVIRVVSHLSHFHNPFVHVSLLFWRNILMLHLYSSKKSLSKSLSTFFLRNSHLKWCVFFILRVISHFFVLSMCILHEKGEKITPE